jgi:hypothetical protein
MDLVKEAVIARDDATILRRSYWLGLEFLSAGKKRGCAMLEMQASPTDP